ncbi:MAG: hypothetical protein AB1846_14710 [Chloroflexota bacterium]
MWNDPIVDEVRRVRDAHARKFNYDLQAIAADLKKQQETSGRKFITLPPRKPTVLPKVRVNKDK